MSFLSKLRQQKSQQGGTQLCYLCTVGPEGRLALRLELCRVSAVGVIEEVIEPYRHQPSHLTQAPPYLNPSDQSVLKHLPSEQYLITNIGANNSADVTSTVWKSIIATAKCFIESHNGWQKLSLNGEYLPDAEWHIDVCGLQTLGWSCPKGLSLVFLGEQAAALDSDAGLLKLAAGDVYTKHQNFVSDQISLKPASVTSFLDAHRTEWQARGLPSPRKLPAVETMADLQVQFFCSGDELTVTYRYICDLVCLDTHRPQAMESESVWSGDKVIVVRVLPERCKAINTLIGACLKGFESPQDGVYGCVNSQLWQQLLIQERPTLESAGVKIVCAPEFNHYYVSPYDWRMQANTSGPKRWNMQLEFELDGERVKVLELLQQLKNVTRSANGQTLELEYRQYKIILNATLFEGLSDELKGLVNHSSDKDLPLAHLRCLKTIKELIGEGLEWSGDAALLQKSLQLHSSPVMLDASSTGVQAELRSYQWLGVCWLQHMRSLGFNALLADDMGLGKTLQTLAHLSLEYRDCIKASEISRQQGVSVNPSLIVVPTSLLSNWANEIRRFCPHLKVQVVYGLQRHSVWSNLEKQQLLVTSYSLVLKDLEQWQNADLHYLVLDEAQTIKNPQSKIAKALKALTPKHKLCLSGTPVENHLGELWSLFDFLEPGFLGSQRQFQEFYRKPIEQQMDQNCFQNLLIKIEPFMLRRDKSQVAGDLPEKTVIPSLVRLDDEQMAFYESLKTSQLSDVHERLSNTENRGEQKILLLTALTRLRQACCDPKLLIEQYPQAEAIGSAKTQHCLEMLQELTSEGRSVLVFSQFTSMLDILADELEQKKMPYLMLTGKSKNRSDLVQSFQQGEASIFLISLKAGGVGLNLTKADTVIHFDPWWNLAAEEQASDRAHRIGQDKAVFVYKLIAESTIEEKIAKLQQSKSQLSQPVAHQAQMSGDAFALELEELIELC